MLATCKSRTGGLRRVGGNTRPDGRVDYEALPFHSITKKKV
jgi:hypothetical protein